MLNKKTGFSLAEALIALLIVSLIIAASLPIITKKTKEYAKHGYWECVVNASGQHVSRTVIGGRDSGFAMANSGLSCSFSPPPNIERFQVTVVGGGGSGGSGTSGEITDPAIASPGGQKTVFAETDGPYSYILQGAGAMGGDKACYGYKNYIESIGAHLLGGTTSDGYEWNNSEDPAMRETYLSMLTTTAKMCFAVDPKTGKKESCWDIPGRYGNNGNPVAGVLELKKGDSITISGGDANLNGGSSCLYYGTQEICASGGGRGYSRVIKSKTYSGVSVIYNWNTKDGPCYNGAWESGPPDEEGNPTSYWNPNGISGYTCDNWHSKPGSQDFTFAYCGASDDSSVNFKAEAMTDDVPPWAKDKEDPDIPSGSGGYGAGKTVQDDLIESSDDPDDTIWTEEMRNDSNKTAWPGQNGSGGYAQVQYVTYSAGTGGKAGGFVSTSYKRLARVDRITIGYGGGMMSPGSDGQAGGTTEFGTLLSAPGGQGGKQKSIFATAADPKKAIGGTGEPSPVNSKIIARGGFSYDEEKADGQNVVDLITNSIFSIFTHKKGPYGAGGGGGGGGVGKAGNGGAGYNGIVFVEW